MPVLRLTRRDLIHGLALTGLAAALPWPAWAATEGQSYPTDQLMTGQPLADIWQGSAGAPVTIIEYASMTCTHCAAFHAETYPVLKSKYIEPGKVRFVLREFPLDALAAAGFMLARAAGPDKRNAIVDLLFTQQKNWAFVEKPIEALASTVKQAGITQTEFETCLKDQKLYDQINAERDQATTKFGVNATPTFFVNGKKVSGEMSPAELDKTVEPLLAKG